MSKVVAAISIFALLISCYFNYKQKNEIDDLSQDYKTAVEKLELAVANNKQHVIVNSILKYASGGLHQTNADTLKDVSRVVDYLSKIDSPVETKFSECWDRKTKTTNWGSDGPYGILDECIDSIANSESAILLREIDNAFEKGRNTCNADGANRFEGAKNCWADSNFRLLMAANNSLFDALTKPNWFDASNVSIGK